MNHISWKLELEISLSQDSHGRRSRRVANRRPICPVRSQARASFLSRFGRRYRLATGLAGESNEFPRHIR